MIPDKDIVWVTTGNALQGDADYEEYAEIFHLFWNNIYPYLSDDPLDEAPEDAALLEKRCANLELHLPAGHAHSPRESKLEGATYRFAEGDANPNGVRSLSLRFTDDTLYMDVALPDRVWTVEAGRYDWRHQELPLAPDEGWAKFVWVDDDTLVCEANCRYRCGTYHFILHFDDSSVSAMIRPSGWSHFGRLYLRMTGEKL